MSNDEALKELFSGVKAHRAAASAAAAEFADAAPRLQKIIDQGTGTSERVGVVIRSLWNGELCDALSSIDASVLDDLVTAMRHRALSSGDADNDLRPLFESVYVEQV